DSANAASQYGVTSRPLRPAERRSGGAPPEASSAHVSVPRTRKPGLMSQYLLQRLLLNVPVVILVISIVFLMVRARPDFSETRAAQGLSNAGDYQQALQAVRHQLGTDRPLWKQYGYYMADIARGDLGTSFITQRPVVSELKTRLAPSIELGL